jgi:pimeloyl-ACP methyl ester carboxylesterase
MRDVGRSLLPVAEALVAHCYCVLPDLRGHGASCKPGNYALPHFLMDARRLLNHLQLARVALIGHSLGGHIACRYAALFADQISALIVVEGLGPPVGGQSETAAFAHTARQLDRAIETAERSVAPRVFEDLQSANRRLRSANPRLTKDWAAQLTPWLTEQTADGFKWAFDARAQEVFLGVSQQRNIDYWSNIEAPTLVIMGELGYQYWHAMRRNDKGGAASGEGAASGDSVEEDGYDGRFSDAELTARMNCFATAQLQEISNAGHQVNYDQPDELGRRCAGFLNRVLVDETPA